jgi:hypothetical protein
LGSWNDIRQPHIDNTRERGQGIIDFWLYTPKETDSKPTVRCGICKDEITGFKSCPRCYPNGVKKEMGEFAVIVRTDPWRETGEIPNPEGAL